MFVSEEPTDAREPMKATISIPNPIYEAAEQLAQKLGVSLSDLYTIALTSYLAAYQADDVVEALNRVYETEPSVVEPGLVDLQVASIGGKNWRLAEAKSGGPACPSQ